MTSAPIVNIADPLKALARSQPQMLAVVWPHGRDRLVRPRYTHYTYRELDEDSDRLAHGLEAIGIGSGTRTVLMVPPSLEFYALTFALFKAGAVIVLIDPGMGVKSLGVCLKEPRGEGIVNEPPLLTAAHDARVA